MKIRYDNPPYYNTSNPGEIVDAFCKTDILESQVPAILIFQKLANRLYDVLIDKIISTLRRRNCAAESDMRSMLR
jgi:hypothetical protein